MLNISPDNNVLSYCFDLIEKVKVCCNLLIPHEVIDHNIHNLNTSLCLKRSRLRVLFVVFLLFLFPVYLTTALLTKLYYDQLSMRFK